MADKYITELSYYNIDNRKPYVHVTNITQKVYNKYRSILFNGCKCQGQPPINYQTILNEPVNEFRAEIIDEHYDEDYREYIDDYVTSCTYECLVYIYYKETTLHVDIKRYIGFLNETEMSVKISLNNYYFEDSNDLFNSLPDINRDALNVYLHSCLYVILSTCKHIKQTFDITTSA